MSKDQLTSIAQKDTPEVVHVPDSWAGILVWAVGRFGAGILLAVACAFALRTVYADWRSDMVLWRDLVKQTSDANAASARALEQVATELSSNTNAVLSLSEEARIAHQSSHGGSPDLFQRPTPQAPQAQQTNKRQHP